MRNEKVLEAVMAGMSWWHEFRAHNEAPLYGADLDDEQVEDILSTLNRGRESNLFSPSLMTVEEIERRMESHDFSVPDFDGRYLDLSSEEEEE